MAVKHYTLQTVRLSDLKEDPTNPNKMKDKQFDGLVYSMEEYGNLMPIVISSDNTIIDGHHRLKALLENKEEWTDVFKIDLSTQEARSKLRQVMNKLRGEHDPELDAKELLTIFQSGELSNLSGLIGQSQTSLENIIKKYNPNIQLYDVDRQGAPQIDKELQEEIINNPDYKPVTADLDIWKLGFHYVICGDFTEHYGQILHAMGEAKLKVAFVFVDPPYNVDFKYREHKDKMHLEVYSDFIIKATDAIKSLGPLNIIVTPGPMNIQVWEPYTDIGIWLKKNGQSGGSAFHLRKCEPILFYGKFEKRSWDLFEFAQETFDHDSQKEVGVDDDQYPPAKPVNFMAELVNCYSKEDEIIIDPMAGQGSTLIACEATNRVCISMEKDPVYCDLIIRKWEKRTGQRAKKVQLEQGSELT